MDSVTETFLFTRMRSKNSETLHLHDEELCNYMELLYIEAVTQGKTKTRVMDGYSLTDDSFLISWLIPLQSKKIPHLARKLYSQPELGARYVKIEFVEDEDPVCLRCEAYRHYNNKPFVTRITWR